MKNKSLTVVLVGLLMSFSLADTLPIKVNAQEYTVDEVNSLIDGIVDYKLSSAGAADIQDWINGSLTDGAGSTSEWYVMTLSQNYQADFSSYENALSSYLTSDEGSSATSKEKYALALSAAGSSNSYMEDILNDSIGQQGIMSYIYGLHVLNNGYTCSDFSADSVVDKLLSMQYGDGGWALFGEYGDIDVTAMTMLALSPYYSEPDVHDSIDRAVSFLSERQQDNGGYQSFGTPNPESAAQVLTAVSAIGIDGIHDERFIKNGNNLIDGIVDYRLSDGSYSHTLGGDTNDTATVQALYSFIAYKRMTEGRSPLFVFDNRQPVSVNAEQSESHSSSEQHQSEDKASASANESSSAVTAASSTVTSSGVTSLISTATTSGFVPAAVVTSETVSVPVASAIVTTAVTTTHYARKTSSHSEKKTDYKPYIIAAIAGAALLISLILFLLKKRNFKNYLFILLCAGAGIAVVMLTDIRSADDYYSGNIVHKDNATGTVSLEIRCDTIVGKSDSEYIPDDGTILEVTDFEIEDGDTVFDILNEAAQTYGIHVENKGGGAHGMVYISGINYIYEYDFGDLSGWVYHVNGITPSRNCGEYVLSDGDEIQWLYTCEIGHDLNEVYEDDQLFQP